MGESLIDVVENASGQVSEHVGGSVFNVARGCARLGLDTTLASWWGDDPHGELLEGAAAQAGVSVVVGSDAACVTPTARAVLDGDGAASYEFDLTWDLPEIADLDEFQHWHVGSYSALLPEGSGKILQYLSRRPSGVTVSYDANVRPALLGDRVSVAAQVEDLVRMVDIAKASDEDLEYLYPGCSRRQVAKIWLGGYWEKRTAGPQIVVFTLGAEGAELYTPWLYDPIRVASVPRGRLADTVGAGDSFMAGLLCSLHENRGIGLGRVALNTLDLEELREVLSFASAAAGVTVTHNGAYSPDREEI